MYKIGIFIMDIYSGSTLSDKFKTNIFIILDKYISDSKVKYISNKSVNPKYGL